MAEQDDIRAGVINRLHTNWSDATLPLVYNGHPEKVDKKNAWGRATFSPASRTDGQIGGGMKRTFGVLFVQIFLIPETGTKQAADVADALNSLFDNVQQSITGGSITYQQGTLTPAGTTGGYAQWNWRVQVRADIFA